MTLSQLRTFARRQGFTIRCRQIDQYWVCSTRSTIPAFIGSMRECYVFILGYCWNRGVQP
jgi:hypothetical protein